MMKTFTHLQRHLLVPLLLLFAICPMAQAETGLEDKVKAAFVYNFAKFIEWPSAGAQPGNSFNICIAGETQLGKTIESSLTDKVIKGRNIRVRKIGHSVGQLNDCHMLYLNGANDPGANRMLEAAHRKPILTIGESAEFTARGGIIQFLVVGGKVRFIINQASAESVGLNISAKLLEVAYRVQQGQTNSNKLRGADRDVIFS